MTGGKKTDGPCSIQELDQINNAPNSRDAIVAMIKTNNACSSCVRNVKYADESSQIPAVCVFGQPLKDYCEKVGASTTLQLGVLKLQQCMQQCSQCLFSTSTATNTDCEQCRAKCADVDMNCMAKAWWKQNKHNVSSEVVRQTIGSCSVRDFPAVLDPWRGGVSATCWQCLLKTRGLAYYQYPWPDFQLCLPAEPKASKCDAAVAAECSAPFDLPCDDAPDGIVEQGMLASHDFVVDLSIKQTWNSRATETSKHWG